MPSLKDTPGPDDPTEGWKPDPLGSNKLRYWDGRGWTAQLAKSPDAKDGMPNSAKWAIGVVGVLAVIGLIAGGGEEDTTDPGPEPAVAKTFPEQVESTTLESVEEEAPPTVACSKVRCVVSYERGPTLGVLLSGQEELLEEQRDIWAEIFRKPSIESARIMARGPITTVGGKERTAPILAVECDRAAAKQIDWNNVSVDGMSALCDWDELVDF